MKTNLITTTAIAALLGLGSGPAFSQANQPADNQTQVQQQPADAQEVESRTVFSPEGRDFEPQDGYFAADPAQILASDLIGMTVYTSSGEERESIGDINDVIMSPNGYAEAVIIGIGGFLGLGEKDVAIAFDQINWRVDADGGDVLVSAVTKESLENAPAFDYALLEREYNRLTRAEREEQMARDGAAQQPAAGGEPVRQDQAANQTQSGGAEVVVIEPNQQGERQPAQQGEQQAAQQGTDQQPAQQQARTVDRESMQPVEMQEITAERVTGATVYSADNEEIGEVSEVLLTNDGQVSAFVVDIGGFLGMGEKSVEINAQELQFSQDEDGNLAIWTNMNRQQLEGMPERQG